MDAGRAASTARSSSRPPCPTRARSSARVLGNDDPEASVAGEVIPSREFYDYEAKYLDAGSQVDHPGRPAEHSASDEIRRLSIEAFKAIDGAGMARVDFLLGASDGQIFVNEVNTIPGFTTISMYAEALGGIRRRRTRPHRSPDRSSPSTRHAEKQQLRTSVT